MQRKITCRARAGKGGAFGESGEPFVSDAAAIDDRPVNARKPNPEETLFSRSRRERKGEFIGSVLARKGGSPSVQIPELGAGEEGLAERRPGFARRVGPRRTRG